MMDPFFDPFWNLDQVRAWACTRDPEVVRFAAMGARTRPSQSSLNIAVRSASRFEIEAGWARRKLGVVARERIANA